MKARISWTVWWWLNLPTSRVPSVSLIWIDVVGAVSSITRHGDGGAAAATPVCTGTGAESGATTDEVPPRVLPTPWNETLGFSLSYNEMKQDITCCWLMMYGYEYREERTLTGHFSSLRIRLTCTGALLSSGSSSFGHSDFRILYRTKKHKSNRERTRGHFGSGVVPREKKHCLDHPTSSKDHHQWWNHQTRR